MYTSDMMKQDSLLRTASGYLGFTAFCVLFGAIYERFSHGVYSYYMIYAFALPLFLIVLPAMIFVLRRKTRTCQTNDSIHMESSHAESNPAFLLWCFGVTTLTIGSLFKGVLDIYGTTNRLIIAYPIAGGILMAAAGILSLRRNAKETEK